MLSVTLRVVQLYELLKDAVSPEVQDYFDYVKQLRARVESAEAEVEKVRELLRDVVDQSFDLGYSQLEKRLKAIIGEVKP